MKRLKRPQETRQIGAANAFVEARMALGRVAFSLEESTKESGLSAIAAKFQLLRLRGKVVRVSPRQPFYLIGEGVRPLFGSVCLDTCALTPDFSFPIPFSPWREKVR